MTSAFLKMLSPECRQVLWPRRLFAHKTPQARDTPCSIFTPPLWLEDKDMHHIPTITACFSTSKMIPLAVTPDHCRLKGVFSFKFETIPPCSSVKRTPQIISRRKTRCAPSISGKEGQGRGRQTNRLYERKLALKNAHGSILFSLSTSR